MSSSYTMVTNKTRDYQCIDVCDWMQTTLFAIDKGESSIHTFIAQYTSLIRTITPTYPGITVPLLLKLARLPHELLYCCFEGDMLAATAQASLTFPAGRAMVHIRNVVVESSRRGKGVGSLIVETLEAACKEKWDSYRPFPFVIIDASERNDDRFFTTLRYQAAPAMQYIRR